MSNIPSTFVPVYPDYLSPKIKKPESVFRFAPGTRDGSRWYAKVLSDGRIRTVISHTSLISYLIPKGPGFYKWVAMHGMKSEDVAAKAAAFGSIYHREALRPLVQESGYDLDVLKERETLPDGTKHRYTNFARLFPPEYREDIEKYLYSFYVGLYSFWEFAKERIIEVFGVELPIISDRWDFGGPLDFVGLIQYDRKPRLAIIDLKSKMFSIFDKQEDKKFYASHEFQLEMQRWLLKERYPELIKEYGEPYLFNFSPVNWKVKMENGEKKGKPSYTLHNQTDNRFSRIIKTGKTRRVQMRASAMFLDAAEIYDLPKPPTHIMDFGGKFDNVHEFDWETLTTISEII